MNFQQLLDDTRQYVQSYFEMRHDPELIYHNFKHTKEVVATATRIANHYQLSDADFFVVIASAWFHDTGYFIDRANHEHKSAELAVSYFKEQKTDETLVEKIKACILATKMPQQPNGLLQEILCDADLFHLGTTEFADKNKEIRKELELTKHREIDKRQWRQMNIELLESHHYFTDYAQLLLADQYDKNLKRLKSKAAELAGEEEETKKPKDEKPRDERLKGERQPKDDQPNPDIKGAPVDVTDKKSKKEKPDKGRETMFRITSSNNQRLSDMADRKAHILITVNSIILSAIISLVLKKLDENSFLAIPSFILLMVSLLSMIFSILATRPTIPKGTFSQADLDDKKVNLLFFGNFYKMQLEEYTKGMLLVMDDTDFLYGTLIKDVYFQGVVLGRKYRFLRAAYNIFMFGLILAVVAFIVASVLHNKTEVISQK